MPAAEGPKSIAAPLPGLAIASLVLGIVACVLSLFVVGGLLGLIGLILGLLHISRKRGPNGMAWWGIGLSIFGILASGAMGIVYYYLVSAQMKQVTGNAFNSWIGTEAPDITLTTLDGKQIRLSELKGKRIVLDFWATWCGPCVKEMPHLSKLYNESSRDDLMIIGISNEDESTVRPFVAEKGVSYPIALSQDLPSPYKDVVGIPTAFFIDRNGIVQSVLVGYRNFDELKSHALAKDF